MAKVINGVDPNDLRFTQPSICAVFQPPYQELFVKDAISKIKRKDMTVSMFPMPKVIKHEDTLWCLDNRRLYVFRKAKVGKIDVQISRLPMHRRLSAVLDNPEDKKKMMMKNFFPYVRKYRPVHATYPPIFISPWPSTSKCSPIQDASDQVASGEMVCVYNKPERLASPMTTAFMKPNDCRDFFPLCSFPPMFFSPYELFPYVHKYRPVHTTYPPIFTSPRPSTSKCSPIQDASDQVASGEMVCMYNKPERLASPMTTAFMKPNDCRDPKPVCSGQDFKGKSAVVHQPSHYFVEEEALSQSPSKISSAAGPTISSERPPSASRMDSRLATSVWKPRPDSISQGMGGSKPPERQPKQVPRAKIHASTKLADHHLINLGTLPNEGRNFPVAAAGPTMSSESPQPETRMEPRLATAVWKPNPDSISQGMGNPEDLKQPKQVPKAKIHASMELPDHHLVNLDTLPNAGCKFPGATAGKTMSSERPQPETRMNPRLATAVGKPKPDSISQGRGNFEAPPKQVPASVTTASMDLLDWHPIKLKEIPIEELPDKILNATILPVDDKPIEIWGVSITPVNHRNERVVDMPPVSEGDPLLHNVPVRDNPIIWSLLHVPWGYISGFRNFVFNLVKKLRFPFDSASASAASNV